MERLISVAEVAELLGVSRNYVYDLANRGDLPSFKINGYRRFRNSDVERWVERHRQAGKVLDFQPGGQA